MCADLISKAKKKRGRHNKKKASRKIQKKNPRGRNMGGMIKNGKEKTQLRTTNRGVAERKKRSTHLQADKSCGPEKRNNLGRRNMKGGITQGKGKQS